MNKKRIDEQRKTLSERSKSGVFVCSFYILYLLFLFFSNPNWFSPVKDQWQVQFTLMFFNILMIVPIIFFVAQELTNLCFPKNKAIFIYTVVQLFSVLIGMGIYLICAKLDLIDYPTEQVNNSFTLYLLVSVIAIVVFTIISTLVWIIMARHITYVGKRTRVWFPILVFVLNTFIIGLIYTTIIHTWTTYVFLLGTSTLTDVFAYLGGVKFGRHKMAPHVSPKKTWEGILCGCSLTLVIILGLFGLMFIPGAENLDHTLYRFLGCQTCSMFAQDGTTLINHQPYFWAIYIGATLAIMAVSISGDLFFSFIKRRFNIKDFSNLIPGHGGMLDRLDALIFTFSFYFLVTVILQLIMLLGFGQAEGLKFLWDVKPAVNFVF